MKPPFVQSVVELPRQLIGMRVGLVRTRDRSLSIGRGSALVRRSRSIDGAARRAPGKDMARATRRGEL